MPLEHCTSDGSPGWRFGQQGQCYTYTAGNATSEAAAKRKAVRQGLAIGGGQPPAEGFEQADFEDVLETVDMEGVEVMRAGGPWFGQNCPPGGAYFTPDDLRRIADASNAVQDETKPANKLGHSFNQALVKNSGLTEGEMPAIGWLTNFRASGDRIVADIKKVPRMVSKLIEAGAFRTRSPELSSFMSRETGATHKDVIRGLSWQGAKPVAITTLQDVIDLYADDLPAERVLYEGMGVSSEEDVRTFDFDAVEEDPPDGGGGDDGSADTTAMPEGESEVKFDEQRLTELREKLGLDPAADDAAIFEAVDALKERAENPPAPDPPDGGEGGGDGTDGGEQQQALPEGMVAMEANELAELKAMAEDGRSAKEELRVKDREEFLKDAMSKGKFAPAQLDEFRKDFDENPDLTRRLLARVEDRPELFEALGSDETGGAEDEQETRLYEELSQMTGVDA